MSYGIAYFIGGPFDLTKRACELRPIIEFALLAPLTYDDVGLMRSQYDIVRPHRATYEMVPARTARLRSDAEVAIYQFKENQ